MKRGRAIFTLGLAIGLLIGLLTAGGVGAGVWAQDATPATGTTTGGELSAVEVVERVGTAVVTVINEQTGQGLSQDQMMPVGSGTGFIIDDQGHIVTNNHVVEGGQQFKVIFANGDQQDATLVGADPVSDLAVVKIDGDVPNVVPLGDSDALKPGQPVLAIGSPLGSFTNTVTQGIISATNRDFPDPSAANYRNLIQHDAAINPGNSGGPLFNMAGEVVGVNTLGIPSENGQPVQGLFFAIPSNTVKKITQLLMQDGRVVYPFFGISYEPVTLQIASQYGLNVDHGVLVTSVSEGGPAEQAGVQEGDVVLSLDGQEINAQDSFADLLFEHKPGDTVQAEIQRGDQQTTVQVTLGERPSGT
ncbi:MAG TPA: trypsin-like peptidase domain-containing protein [Thermomicrobiales bacterium]|nr:trypsin-like peptidase domain-containing protein [Thermomicrobiales bacterium]